jgi:biopolymer transport protein ExbD/biopolymer transport protein TolR
VTGPISDQQGFRAEINVTPLVDVVLVLLLIFMVVTPLLKQEAPVDVPIERHSADASDTRQLTLAIAADGGLTLAGEALDRERLGERLEAVLRDRNDRTLFLAADRSLSYSAVVDVIDACRAAGVSAIGIVTRKPVE